MILAELESPSNFKLNELLRTYTMSHKLSEAVDESGFNLLHHAVLKGIPGKVFCLIQWLPFSESDRRLEWVNGKTTRD